MEFLEIRIIWGSKKTVAHIREASIRGSIFMVVPCSLCWIPVGLVSCRGMQSEGAGTAGVTRWASPSSPSLRSLREHSGRQMALISCANLISSHQSYWKTFLWGTDGYHEAQTLLGEREILILNVVVSGFRWPCFWWENHAFSRFLHVLFRNAVAHNIEIISLGEGRDK